MSIFLNLPFLTLKTTSDAGDGEFNQVGGDRYEGLDSE